jgi:hypothetical protein
MSLKPAAVDPPPHEDRRGTDLPQFKDQVSPFAAGPHPPRNDRRGTDPPQFNHQLGRVAGEVPLAEATPVAASLPITSDSNTERLLRLQKEKLEAQLELERQRVENLQQQQRHQQRGGRPISASTTGSAANCSFTSKQKRWIALGIVLVAVVAVVLAVVIAMVVNSPEPPGVPVVPASVAPATTAPVPLPTPPPTPPPARVDSIVSYINRITLSGQKLSYPPIQDTAEERAVQWLIEEDLHTPDTADLQALRQRYALSTLWFIPTPTPFGDNNHADTWITNLNECNWQDVTCDDDGRVTALFLAGDNVRGRIPDDLVLLTAMTSLQLYVNQITGTIPSSLAAMTDLIELWLRTNRLTGTIPSSLGLLTGLMGLELWDNQLNGTIPSSLAALTALTDLRLHNNQLNGTLPLCGLNRTFKFLVVDCAEVSCPCCTHCCPTASEDGTIPVYDFC